MYELPIRFRSRRLIRVEAARTRDQSRQNIGAPSHEFRFHRPDGMLSPKNTLHLAKAVSPMQACAVHLRDRTPRRCRADDGHQCHRMRNSIPNASALTRARSVLECGDKPWRGTAFDAVKRDARPKIARPPG
ncbi:MAG: hypothetical protein B7Z37_30385 [Verrucomicrobia bacterium 12-59-8]|nr:MAG: hypothetical protein B7Z37_30385 [Verrucomicrobia bacterium 12-59-8]